MYSYDVFWKVSTTRWASRWDAYLRMPGGKVHWFSILNSILIVLVMATLVAMILIRTVRKVRALRRVALHCIALHGG